MPGRKSGVPRPSGHAIFETLALGSAAAALIAILAVAVPHALSLLAAPPALVFGLFGCAWGILEGRRQVYPGGRETDARGRPLIIASFFAVLAASIGDYLFLPPLLPRGTALPAAGGLLMGAGLALRAWAMRSLGPYFTHRVTVREDHRLVEKGPYRWVRHPGYAGELLLFAGTAVCWSSAVGLAAAGLAVAAAVHRMRTEERLLRATFGPAYDAYESRTGRVLPRRGTRVDGARLAEALEWVVGHARAVLVATGLITCLLAGGLLALSVKFDIDQVFPPGHPFVQVDRTVRRLFGGRHFVAIMVRARRGHIWTGEALGLVADLTEELRRLPGVIPQAIMSLASPNARWFRSLGNQLREEYVMREVPRDARGIEALRERVMAHPLYRGRIVSGNERAALVSADFYDQVPEPEISHALRALIARHRSPCCELYVTGMPVLVETVNSYVMHMWPRFALAFLVVAAVLYLSFRSWQGTIIPLLTGGLAALWAMGIAAYLGMAVDMFNNMSPVLVLAIGAGHSGQMLKRYYEELARLKDNRAAVLSATAKMAPIMLAAGVTAAAGFASLLFFRLPSLRTFGLVTAAGIACAVVLEMTFVPALRSLLPVRRVPAGPGEGLLDRALLALGRALERRPAAFVAAGVLVAAAGLAAAPRMPTSYSFPDYLPPASAGRRHLDTVQAEFPGIVPLVVLLEGKQGFASEPATLSFVRGLQQALEEEPEVVFSASYADVLGQAYRALSGDDTGAIPANRAAIAQLLYLAHSGQMDRFVSSDARRLALWSFLDAFDTATVSRALARANRFRDRNRLPGVQVRIAGGAGPLEVALNEETVRGKALNIVAVLVVIFLVASAMLRSPLAGALVLTPLLVTVAVVFGLLGALRIPLDLVTATIAAVSVGIGADYTIYLLYRLREEQQAGADPAAAMARALGTSGKAILFVATSIAAGYATLGVSEFPAFRLTGLLVPVTMAVSSLSALTVMLGLAVLLGPQVVAGGHTAGSGGGAG